MFLRKAHHANWIAIVASIIIATFIFAISQNSYAAPRNKRAVAVIIGNKDYAGRIPDVDFAINDADAFKAFVIDVLGYDAENIIDMRDATQAQMMSAFGNRETHEGDLWRYLDPKGRSDVVVFYSGHGVPGLKDKRGYLLPVDANPNAPEINGFPVDVLFANLNKLETKSVSVFLDACFSGDSEKGMLVRATSGVSIAPKVPEKLSSGMTIITAAQGDQVASWDFEAKHGLFTKHLLDALYGAADKDDVGNNDDKIVLSEVSDYLVDNMTRAARRTCGRHQTPWVTGDRAAVLANVLPESETSGQKTGRPDESAARQGKTNVAAVTSSSRQDEPAKKKDFATVHQNMWDELIKESTAYPLLRFNRIAGRLQGASSVDEWESRDPINYRKINPEFAKELAIRIELGINDTTIVHYNHYKNGPLELTVADTIQNDTLANRIDRYVAVLRELYSSIFATANNDIADFVSDDELRAVATAILAKPKYAPDRVRARPVAGVSPKR
ncbi:MAG: caspase family protein [Alphaproteobacteria bacterium]|jgi:hypothetical protein|nr:caspase family protein [Alphaproteobacteria bacterium]MBT4083816.1 caspase family protein [Alphaproteobacteria bacterium]MBT4542880.1 caspase family protein [Alphaproteobacteria bacterium]MBT7744256.1 caspase family protein [Alphaproteobacteria bacterium]